MGIERHRPLPIAPPRPSGLAALLASLLKRQPAGGAGDDGVEQLLDRLQVLRTRQGATAEVQAHLAALKRGAAAQLPPAGWQALGAHVQGLAGAERDRTIRELAAVGVSVESGADRRFVSFKTEELRVIVEPAAQRVRRTQGETVLCYEAGQLAQAMKLKDNQVEVTTREGTRTWVAGTGQGWQDGLPVVPRFAARVPGEPARRPWASPLSNDLREPRWSNDTDMGDYAPAYDAAMRATGGRIVEASDPDAVAADLYNCHSFAVTGGKGDLFDPFLRESHPHWINNPMHRLLNGPFAQLHADQAVKPGDVIVYRQNGKVTHTGVVREVDANGNPSLIESKFGVLGRYVHEPFDIPRSYGAPAEFFRPEAA